MASSASTIFALASAPGKSGVAVFRISGVKAAAALEALTSEPLPDARRLVRAVVRDARGEIIDDGLVAWFPKPHSFTGEDVVELHLHGGRAVANALGDALVTQGLRPAEPGEFSRRAFIAGKLDLTRAEGIADLVDAETAAQRRQALRQMGGALATIVEGWRGRLLRAQAHIEAEIDFVEDGLPQELGVEAKGVLTRLADEMAKSLADQRRGERLRDGFQVVLLGPPNVGKSSIINKLAGRDAAIVAASAGTTRDVIEVHLDLGGFPVTIADTAGLREAEGEVEAEGIRRSRSRAEDADLRLVVFDATALPRLDPEARAMLGPNAIALFNKRDVAAGMLPESLDGAGVLALSAKTGLGFDSLVSTIATKASDALEAGGAAVLTRARHRAAVTQAEIALRQALRAALPELVAEDVRHAADALGRITGRIDIEEMLDVIFREFCIGK
ncbi:MAG TPA: tRNA uridine-5-carboxymethylaminomethyl(34) synthesis GTPase MnmE [Magnetospirillaceae bacterium]|jgi:tRNA modification GTPase